MSDTPVWNFPEGAGRLVDAKDIGPYQTAEGYVLFFKKIWSGGDPSSWGEKVFTPTARMEDPTGSTNTAREAARDFQVLFHYFPDLRGEVMSWAANEHEIFINWAFVIGKNRVAVCDKFCLSNGLVCDRLAYFDSTALLAYLTDVYDAYRMYLYFQDRFGGLNAKSRKLAVALFRGFVMTFLYKVKRLFGGKAITRYQDPPSPKQN